MLRVSNCLHLHYWLTQMFEMESNFLSTPADIKRKNRSNERVKYSGEKQVYWYLHIFNLIFFK